LSASVQVARPPDTHVVWPDEQLSVQFSEHPALGASPEHDSGLEHGEVEST
jgi:hypothetical protein